MSENTEWGEIWERPTPLDPLDRICVFWCDPRSISCSALSQSLRKGRMPVPRASDTSSPAPEEATTTGVVTILRFDTSDLDGNFPAVPSSDLSDGALAHYTCIFPRSPAQHYRRFPKETTTMDLCLGAFSWRQRTMPRQYEEEGRRQGIAMSSHSSLGRLGLVSIQ